MKVKHGLHILVTAALLTLPLSGCVGENSEVSPKSTSSDTAVSSTAEISEISEETSSDYRDDLRPYRRRFPIRTYMPLSWN